MAEKITTMVLKVNLQCPCCYKKVKKVLCKFPQIRNQIYDEKQNTVKITVVCCDPEKLRDKLCCKGGKAIKSIEIKEPDKPKPQPQPQPQPQPPPEKKEPVKTNPPSEKKKPPPEKKEPEKKDPPPEKKVPPPEKKEPEKKEPPPEKKEPPPKEPEKKDPPPEKNEPPPKKEPEKKEPPPAQPPVCYPPAYPVCCGQCYHGQPGGPCHLGYESRPVPSYDGWGYGYGCGCGCGCGGHRRCYKSPCDDYFSEENPSGCTIM